MAEPVTLYCYTSSHSRAVASPLHDATIHPLGLKLTVVTDDTNDQPSCPLSISVGRLGGAAHW